MRVVNPQNDREHPGPYVVTAGVPMLSRDTVVDDRVDVTLEWDDPSSVGRVPVVTMQMTRAEAEALRDELEWALRYSVVADAVGVR